MKCDAGRLRAYLDKALTPAEESAVSKHLSACALCQAELAVLRDRELLISGQLASLDPRRDQVPDAVQALRAFRVSVLAANVSGTKIPVSPPRPSRSGGGGWQRFKETSEMIKETVWAGRRRTALIGASALACLLILFSLAPVRQAAADFLGIFRVRKFAVIAVDPSQVQRLEAISDSMGANAFGEPIVLREAGEPQTVADAAEASAVAGFAVRMPSALPDGARLTRFVAEPGPAFRFEADRSVMEALLSAAGITDVTLPPMDKVTVDVDVPTAVTQEYGLNGSYRKLTITQLPSPQATLPEGLDPAALGEIALQLLGMPPADARSLAQTIDWTSTVVIPMPTDVGRSREVTVDGVTGVLLEEAPEAGGPNAEEVVLWERDGIVCAVQGENISVEIVLQVADSLR